MTKDDWYFLISTILGLLGLLSMDWKLILGRVSVRSRGRQIFLLVLVAGCLVMTSIGWYRLLHRLKELSVTISAYAPVYPSPIRVIKDQTFENTDVPLDGYDYDGDTFTNVCFLYDGGSYQLQNVTLKDHWQICAKKDELKNYLDLMDAFRLLDPNRKQSSHSTVGRP